VVRQDDFVRSLVILECWRQGCDFGNSQIPLIIAGCLSNRVRCGWGSWLEVLQKIPKFSATIEQPNRDKWLDIWSPEFIKLLHSIEGVHDGSVSNPALEGIYWCDLRNGIKGITNPWFRDKILASPLHSVCCNQNSFTVLR